MFTRSRLPGVRRNPRNPHFLNPAMSATTAKKAAQRAAVIDEYLAEFRRVNGRDAKLLSNEARFIRIETDEIMPTAKFTIGELTAAIGRFKTRPAFNPSKESDAPAFSLDDIPEYPQRQDALNNQLRDLHAVANRLGMYDAADLLRRHLA